jgi:hypothetical protein
VSRGKAPCDGEISFFGLVNYPDPNIARNGNQRSKLAYFILAQTFLTGLNRAVLTGFSGFVIIGLIIGNDRF